MSIQEKERKDSFRGITPSFATAVKENPVFQEFYLKHKDKVIVGIRDNYINLYYNCDSIAKFDDTGETPFALIDPYYLGINMEKDGLVEINPAKYDLSSIFETITRRSDERNKREKQSQEKLYIANNQNQDSNWFCIDVEYTRSIAEKDKAEPWRFDIIAVSKTLPHRVALIELKYGFGALKPPSGIAKHVADFYDFHTNESYKTLLPEIISIIKSMEMIGVFIPSVIKEHLETSDFCEKPEYFFITLNNNPDPDSRSDNTPQKTASGYLFMDKKWGCRRVSRRVGIDGFYAVVGNDKSFHPTFLFSKAVLPDLAIDNIIDSELYEEGLY